MSSNTLEPNSSFVQVVADFARSFLDVLASAVKRFTRPVVEYVREVAEPLKEAAVAVAKPTRRIILWCIEKWFGEESPLSFSGRVERLKRLSTFRKDLEWMSQVFRGKKLPGAFVCSHALNYMKGLTDESIEEAMAKLRSELKDCGFAVDVRMPDDAQSAENLIIDMLLEGTWRGHPNPLAFINDEVRRTSDRLRRRSHHRHRLAAANEDEREPRHIGFRFDDTPWGHNSMGGSSTVEGVHDAFIISGPDALEVLEARALEINRKDFVESRERSSRAKARASYDAFPSDYEVLSEFFGVRDALRRKKKAG